MNETSPDTKDLNINQNTVQKIRKKKKPKKNAAGLYPRDVELEKKLFTKSNAGINFLKYDDIPVTVDMPEGVLPMDSFESADLGPVIKNNISLAQFTTPTPIQKYAIPIILSRNDLMGCAQTGSGKTAAFLFPIISLLIKFSRRDLVRNNVGYPECLILSPTRELSMQIHDEAKKYTYRSNLRTAIVYGGVDFSPQLDEISKGCHILVATPGRLIDFIEQNKINLERVRFLCIDEADRMLDLGFKDQLRSILKYCPGPETRQTLMFSATFPASIQKLALKFLTEFTFLRVGKVASTTEFITQKVIYVKEEDKRDELLKLLSTIEGRTLVFVETKRASDRLEEFLFDNQFPVVCINGDRSQTERDASLESFRSGFAKIMVATDVASRGLDINDVKQVINYDLPSDFSVYIHRIGRTGRCGNEGLATSFYSEKNKNIARLLVEFLEDHSQQVENWLYEEARIQGAQVPYYKLEEMETKEEIKRGFITPGGNMISNSGNYLIK